MPTLALGLPPDCPMDALEGLKLLCYIYNGQSERGRQKAPIELSIFFCKSKYGYDERQLIIV